MLDEDLSVGVPKAGTLDLAFAAFVLTHTGCGDGVVELRLRDDLLLEWCPVCAALGVFGASGATRDPISRQGD